MYRKEPSTFKPNPARVSKLIQDLNLSGLLSFDERNRSLKFFRKYAIGGGAY